MAAIKKTKLYSSLWASCDELRGGMDASQYKDYILTLLFVKYVSDKYKGDPDALIVIPKGGSFDDIIALKGNKNIGEEIDKIIAKLASENGLTGIIDNAKFNDTSKLGQGKEMTDKLTNIVGIFQGSGLDFKNNRADGDDIIGDAYEYLMRHFATEAGKSKGSFYTPAEVSRVLAKIVGVTNVNPKSEISVYDPACGSGSLLIKVADEAPNANKISIYGQEKDITTAGLARMNFVLHNFPSGEVAGNYSTFSDPQYWEQKKENVELRRFDFIVANPPFSTKNWTNGYKDYGRMKDYDDKPPQKNGDYAWLLHIIKSMKNTAGKAAVILPHGVLFRGNAEAGIRKAIIDKGYIKGIIGLPANLFYGTGIPACIIVLDKENAAARTGIFMIDASRNFAKDGNKNRLRERDIYKIVKHFNGQIFEDKYSRFVPYDEIKVKNNYNLNIPRYIDGSEEEDIQNIDGHLNGGIPQADVDALKEYWNVFGGLKEKLFGLLRDGFYKLNIEKDAVRQTIYADSEFSAYAAKIDKAFAAWQQFARTKLLSVNPSTVAKELIVELAEKLVNEYKDITLIDKYDVYEVLLYYWQEVMADDIHLILKDGYISARELEIDIEQKKSTDKKTGEEKTTEREKGWDGKIIPKGIVAKAFFKKEADALAEVEAIIEASESKLAEIAEEHAGEEGVFNDCECLTDKGGISTDAVKKVIAAAEKAIKKGEEPEIDEDNLRVLQEYIKYDAQLKEKKKLVRDMAKLLWDNVRATYALLTEAEIKDLVLNKKWFTAVNDGIEALYTAISTRIASRIALLAERYDETLPAIEKTAGDLEDKVKSHLERMGFTW